MITRKEFFHIQKLLAHRQLSSALSAVSRAVETDASQLKERHDMLTADYDRLLAYYRQGFADPARDGMVTELIEKTYALAADAYLSGVVNGHQSYKNAATTLRHQPMMPDRWQEMLERHSSDLALIQLNDDEQQRQQQRMDAHRGHLAHMQTIFFHLWLSPQWSAQQEQSIAQLLLSPLVEPIDRQVMVSAIGLSLSLVFDPRKWHTLARVFAEADDEQLRQRALVGWVLATEVPADLFADKRRQTTEMLMYHHDAEKQLLEMQKQMFLCTNAESDHKEIQRDIMPSIIRNSNLNITRLGIEEKDDDPMQDILDPDAADRQMEEVEQHFRRMADMQKQGSDIFFGGFAQMKRYSFFMNIYNWFCPFYIEHPDLQSVIQYMQDKGALTTMIYHSPLCDSDRYSFALAMRTVIDRLPPSVREMMGSKEALGPTVSEEESATPAFHRRTYLQNLYRFFRLYQDRKDFVSPFPEKRSDDARMLKLCRHSLHPWIHQWLRPLGRFLVKQQRYEALERWLASDDNENVDHLLLRGALLMHKGEFSAAADVYCRALTMQQSPRTTKALARALFMAGDYAGAGNAYREIVDTPDDTKAVQLNYCVCLIENMQADEALPRLFRIQYEREGDASVTRVLAWALLSTGRISDANRELQRVLQQEKPVADDYLNAGYGQWIQGEIANAISLFQKFVKLSVDIDSPDRLLERFSADAGMLTMHGLPATECAVMADAVFAAGIPDDRD